MVLSSEHRIAFGNAEVSAETRKGEVFFVRMPSGEILFLRFRQIALAATDRAVSYDVMIRMENGVWRSQLEVAANSEFSSEFRRAAVFPYRYMIDIEWRRFEGLLNGLWFMQTYGCWLPGMKELAWLMNELDRVGADLDEGRSR